MHRGEAKPNRLFPYKVAGGSRRGTLWRRLVAAAVALAFATTLVSLGFHRYAHHAADMARFTSVAFLTPN